MSYRIARKYQIEQADKALYQAKKTGRNQVVVA
jgi:PleD family two-component response regulator